MYIYILSQYMDKYIYMWYMIYGDALFLGLPHYIWWEHFGLVDMGKCWMGTLWRYIMGCTNGDDLPTPYQWNENENNIENKYKSIKYYR